MPALISLPVEVLTRCCQCLSEEGQLRALVALAQTNKYLHSIANPLLFHDIHLDFPEGNGDDTIFGARVQNCRDLLRRYGAVRHVRRLFIDDDDRANVHKQHNSQQPRRSNPSFASDPLPALDVLNMFSNADLPQAIHCVLRRPTTNDFNTA
ncbi:hypothetical protein QBC47DRAFT_418854 [Echria macrotheca]|uniref:F-box domain-containing protein n=1 Tax=Echria macrotheca TaxID=438768 RepID=A0AAJ0B2E0_9PEZI|nr:hypothetical protein QBC47DRAFT_418854 [Echria macrotheca]